MREAAVRTWDCVGWRRGGCNICLTLMPVRRAVDDTCEALLPCVQTIRRVNGEDKSRVREEILARNGGAKVAASFRSPTRLSIHTATALLSAAPPDAYLRARDLAKLPLWPHEIQVLNAGAARPVAACLSGRDGRLPAKDRRAANPLDAKRLTSYFPSRRVPRPIFLARSERARA
jgi:hypothetical protein